LQSGTLGFPSVIDGVFTSDGTEELRAIFGKQIFAFPKPSLLIRDLLDQAVGDGDIVLDSFAGTGTTAHAALRLSAEVGKDAHFVVVQQTFDTKENEREKLNVCQKITRVRVERIIEGYNSDAGKVKGLGGSFSYARVGEPLFDEYRQFPKTMPAWEDLAKYIFYTETSQQLDLKKLDPKSHFIGATEAAGGTSYYLHYTPDRTASEPVTTKQLKELLKRDKRKNWVIYCEKIWVHQDDLAVFQRENNKRIRLMQVPFQMK
jgi:hypothetical protein